jgi:hypothetical protein
LRCLGESRRTIPTIRTAVRSWSALVAGALTAVGWLLLSTGAAGATRILTRR